MPEIKTVIAESSSTGKRMLLVDRGYVFKGERRKSIIIEQEHFDSHSMKEPEWNLITEFSLTKERALAIASAITEGWEPQ